MRTYKQALSTKNLLVTQQSHIFQCVKPQVKMRCVKILYMKTQPDVLVYADLLPFEALQLAQHKSSYVRGRLAYLSRNLTPEIVKVILRDNCVVRFDLASNTHVNANVLEHLRINDLDPDVRDKAARELLRRKEKDFNYIRYPLK